MSKSLISTKKKTGKKREKIISGKSGGKSGSREVANNQAESSEFPGLLKMPSGEENSNLVKNFPKIWLNLDQKY